MRLGSSMYLFIVMQDQSNSVPLATVDSAGRAPQMSLRWQVSIEAEIEDRWSQLEYRDGGGSAAAGPNGTEFIAQQVYTLPSSAHPQRNRLRYELADFEPIEEELAF